MTNPNTSAVSILQDLADLDALTAGQPHDKHLTGQVALDFIKRTAGIARTIARKANVIESQRDNARELNTELQQTVEAQSEEITKLRGQLEERAQSAQTGTQAPAGSPIADVGGSAPEPHDTTGLTSRVDDFPPTT